MDKEMDSKEDAGQQQQQQRSKKKKDTKSSSSNKRTSAADGKSFCASLSSKPWLLFILAFALGMLVTVLLLANSTNISRNIHKHKKKVAASATRLAQTPGFKKVVDTFNSGGGKQQQQQQRAPTLSPSSSGAGSADEYVLPPLPPPKKSSPSSSPVERRPPSASSSRGTTSYWPSPCENDRVPSAAVAPPPCVLVPFLRGTIVDANANNGTLRLAWKRAAKPSFSSSSTGGNNNNNNEDEFSEIEEIREQMLQAKKTDAIRSYTELDFSSPDRLDSFVLLSRFTFFDFFRLYRNVTVAHVQAPDSTPATCMLAIQHTENCEMRRESLVDCVARMGGPGNVAMIVPRICHGGRWWLWFTKRTRRWMKARGMALSSTNRNALARDPNAPWHTLKRGVIPRSTVMEVLHEQQAYVPPEKRTVTPYGKPTYCRRTGVLVHAISYGVPASTIVDKVDRESKIFDWMPSKMRKWSAGGGYSYDLKTEMLFRQSYTSAFFQFCNRRGGWESLRQYEILASGCVPFFADISRAPRQMLNHLPKKLLAEILRMPGIEHVPAVTQHSDRFSDYQKQWYDKNGENFHFKRRPVINTERFNTTRYFEIADFLLDWTKKYLTCGAIVASMLKRLGKENAKRVLISVMTINEWALWQPLSDSYQVNTILQGFNELGINVTIIAPRNLASIAWRYRFDGFSRYRKRASGGLRADNDSGLLRDMTEDERGEICYDTDERSLYGNGMTYKCRAPNREYDRLLIKEEFLKVQGAIRNREYDLIVFPFMEGTMRTHAPLLQLAAEHYARNEIVIADHLDHHVVNSWAFPWVCDIATIFVRESDERVVCNTDQNRPPPVKSICPVVDTNSSDVFVRG